MEEDLSLCLYFRANSLSAVLYGVYDFDFYRPILLLLCFTTPLYPGNSETEAETLLESFGKTFAFSVIGVATASVLIVPVFYNLLESKGQVGDAMKFSLAFQINPVDILSKLAIGGFDTASGWSAGPNLPNIYIGALGF